MGFILIRFYTGVIDKVNFFVTHHLGGYPFSISYIGGSKLVFRVTF